MNDLIGLTYSWNCKPSDGTGKTDCFQLCCEVRRRLGLYDYASEFAWVYETYAESALPRTKISRLLLQLGQRTTTPQDGDPVIFPSITKRGALGTFVENSVLLIGPRQNVIRVPHVAGTGYSFRLAR